MVGHEVDCAAMGGLHDGFGSGNPADLWTGTCNVRSQVAKYWVARAIDFQRV